MNSEENTNVQQVIIEAVGGDLRIQGQTGAGFRVESGDPVEIFKDETGETITIHSNDDCAISLAEDINLHIKSVGSDAKVAGITHGEVQISSVGSDLIIKNTGACHIKAVGSDCVGKNIEGNLHIGTVGSDVSLRNITGNLVVEDVGADISVRNVEGNLKIARVGSDLSVRDITGDCICENIASDIDISVAFSPEHTYRLDAGGDILITPREDMAVRFIMPIDTEFQSDLEAVTETADEESQKRIVVIGESEGDNIAEVVIEGASRVFMMEQSRNFTFDFDFDFGDMDFNISEQISEHINNLEARIHQYTGNIGEMVSQSLESVAEKMSRKSERMRQQAERQASRAERTARRAERQSGRGRRFAMRDRQRQSTWEPVTSEERRMILDMLASGKLSVEEAERLLQTLESEQN